MRQLLLILFTTLIVEQFAIAAPSLQIGPELGLNISKNNDAYTRLSGAIFTLRIGIIANVGNDRYALQSGIFYTTQGGSKSYGASRVTTSGSLAIHYIEMPVWVQFKSKLKYGKLIFGLGPGIGVGVNGAVKDKSSVTQQLEADKQPVKFGEEQSFDSHGHYINSGDYYYKRLNYMINFNIAYEMPMGLFLRPYASIGLRNLAGSTLVENTHTFSFGLSGGYFMKLKKKAKAQ